MAGTKSPALDHYTDRFTSPPFFPFFSQSSYRGLFSVVSCRTFDFGEHEDRILCFCGR